MGTHDIARVDLTSFAVSWIRNVGSGPRHLVLSPDGTALYATLNGDGKVAKIDPVNGVVQDKVSTGNQPRSMAISTDGQSLYVVNYESSDVTKLAASDLHTLQTVPVGHHPIGITYDRSTGAVWVAIYDGSIQIFSSAERPSGERGAGGPANAPVDEFGGDERGNDRQSRLPEHRGPNRVAGPGLTGEGASMIRIVKRRHAPSRSEGKQSSKSDEALAAAPDGVEDLFPGELIASSGRSSDPAMH